MRGWTFGKNLKKRVDVLERKSLRTKYGARKVDQISNTRVREVW